ncbi:prephenate dehydrogenase/arogenate dehydrogenase family protein [Photorhabdus antumapuensis]|uniref:prephenate dehydrogenase/arogenate dehydrogenase family protein n=1 Tax=Photorhabdus antumapuensis TaxID=2862867 RepID=UPI001CEC2E62|nr:prephenate dehydrogenase/arogenate dehydrogenase family protein [Photorhabdus antumapuensis]MCA6221501.1 prephenate dehydrogenase/arogenate dehydrogenase family protein [Photorhabdus antumapuensis]
MNRNVVIFGGAGVVGSFISKIYKSNGYSVQSVDKNGSTELGHITQDCLEIVDKRPELLDWASILIFALPEDVASNCLRAVAPRIKPGKHGLINTCSAQHEFHDLANSLCFGCESVGVNPMFSPTLDCESRPMVVCENTSTSLGRNIEEILVREKMNVFRLTPIEHDEMMSLCQGLPHALILAFLFNIPADQEKLASLLAVAPHQCKR